MRSSLRANLSEARDTRLALALATEPRCPHCNKPCRDDAALRRHVAALHPKFPPASEEGSD